MNWTLLRERLLKEVTNVRPPTLPLPPLPKVAAEFVRAADSPDPNVAQLSAIIDRDASMLVELLRYVNSSTFAVRQRVSSSRNAISLLGIKRTKMFVLTASVQAVSQGCKSPLASQADFSFAAMQRAILARRLAERFNMDGDLAFAAGLLQDFTIPALTCESPDRYKALTQQARTDGSASLADLERARNGWDHALAGARLMLSWKFPDDLICMTMAHHWLEGVLATSELRQTELLPVALSALLPGPLDGNVSRVTQLESILADTLKFDVGSLRDWVQQDLLNSGVTANPELCWKSAPASTAPVSPPAPAMTRP